MEDELIKEANKDHQSHQTFYTDTHIVQSVSFHPSTEFLLAGIFFESFIDKLTLVIGVRIRATNFSISGLTRSGGLTCLGMLGNQAGERSIFCDSHADALSVIPTAVLRNLSDKLYY
ncbi:hypothetical protein Syun_022940 [Stephania yunnanensis]|uniref:Uncharacterized protein n=1 Tax=Stephania yunnanensis TaxID=152371 RepID=A0AAP0FM97_9MAGN